MATDEEIKKKEKEKARYEKDLKACNKELGSINDQLKEVDQAIEQMTAVYSGFKTKVKDLDNTLDADLEFKGNQKDSLITREGKRLYSDAVYCRDKVINKALDDLEWLKSDLQARKNEKYGLLGKLKSAIEKVGTWLETHTNS